MLKQFTNRLSSVSPRVAIVAALALIVAISGVALLLTRGSHDAAADTSVQPYAARIDRVDGSVGIAQAGYEDKELDWAEATLNTPVSVGDRIYARDGSSASIALTAHDYVQLNSSTALDVLSLEDQRTQLALRNGSALFDVRQLESDDLYEVATPCGAVHFTEPGLYQVGMDGDNAIISVLSGLAQVVGQDGFISKGQVLTLVGAVATQALASRIAPNLAGNIVDDYYRGRYPSTYDGRYQSYDAYLDDPFYYDPYRTSASSQYLSADIPGVYDLDDYGDWVDVNNYGRCWAPRVNAGWAPFRSGRWDLEDVWGPSWISSEPWGWAPYHYGRWASANQRWFWVPGELRTRREYCPAPVAFIQLAEEIAWVPLGPGEVYVPRYYDESFRPRYLASQEVINVVTVQRTFVNYNAPGAVTVVPLRSLNRMIGPGVFTAGDVRVFANARPVIDPFAVEGIRQLAMRREDGRRRLRFARDEQEIFNRPVVASARPEAWRVRSDLTKAMRAEVVPEKQRKNKIKINETGEFATSRRGDGLPQPLVRSQQNDPRMAALAARAEQGDKSARREMRQLMRQEQAGQPQQQAGQQQAQQEQSRLQMKQQRKAERQQQAGQQQQQAGQQQAQQEQLRQQMKQQRKAERQQQAGQQQPQQQQVKQQRKAERQQQAGQQQAQQQQQMKQQRKAERQQQAGQQQPQQQQVKQQRKVERQQQQQDQVRQQEQTRQQRKQQKQKPPQASVQPQANQEAARQDQMAQQQRQQIKAQRRVEQQRQAMVQEQNSRAAIQSAQQAQAREQMKAQRAEQQRASAVDQNRPNVQAAQQQAAQQAQAREQMKAQRRAERQTAAAQQQATPNSAPPSDKAQRKAERRRPPQ